jgi:hypothetical protein
MENGSVKSAGGGFPRRGLTATPRRLDRTWQSSLKNLIRSFALVDIAVRVRLQCVLPESGLIDRVEKFEFQFEQAEPAFNFSVCLRVFHSDDDVIAIVLVEKFLERMNGGTDHDPRQKRTGYRDRSGSREEFRIHGTPGSER